MNVYEMSTAIMDILLSGRLELTVEMNSEKIGYYYDQIVENLEGWGTVCYTGKKSESQMILQYDSLKMIVTFKSNQS